MAGCSGGRADNAAATAPRPTTSDKQPSGDAVTTTDADAIETRVKLPAGASPLRRYARYYTYVTVSGHRIIQGYFIALDGYAPGRYLNTEGPVIFDGGCGVVTIYYDPRRAHIVGIFCNGSA